MIYYVEYATGSDAANGTSSGTPWKHCPGDPSATGSASSATLASGDTVEFKGGVTYTLAGATGIAAVNDVTYEGSDSWGTGKAIVTDGNGSNNITAFKKTGTLDGATFKNFDFSDIGGGTLPADTGSPIAARPGNGIAADTLANVLVQDCKFDKLGYYQNVKPIANSSLAGGGVGCSACYGLQILDCEFSRMRNPVIVSGGNTFNLTVSGCDFHDQMEWGITLTLSSTGVYRSHVSIYGNSFTNTDQYYVDESQGGQWTAYDTGGPHCNCIMVFGPEAGSGNEALDRTTGDDHVYIYRNYFESNLGFPGGSTNVWLQDSASGYIYNNVFNNSSANNCIVISELAANTPCTIGIYNNTCYSGNPMLLIGGTVGDAHDFSWRPVNTSAFIDVRNNILSTLSSGNNNAFDYQINVGTDSANAPRNIAWDYNCYLCDQQSGGEPIAGNWTPGDDDISGYLPISRTRLTPFLWDAHSIGADPLFVRAETTSVSSNDFRLQSSSPVIGAGVNLSSLELPGLDTDFTDRSRPSSAAWDMGAYQYVDMSADNLVLNKTTNSSQVTDLWSRAPAAGGSYADWSYTHSGNYPADPPLDYVYRNVGGKTVYIFLGDTAGSR